MKNHTLKLLFSREAVITRVHELSQQISADYQGRHLIIIGILKGSFVFLADLMRGMTIDLSIDFVQIASYGAFKNPSGGCSMVKDLDADVTGREILIVEDIVDSGETLSFLMRQLNKKNPRSLKTCALIDKKARRRRPVPVDYCGFSIDDGFIVGFGLDYAEKYRSLPGIYELVETAAD